MTKFIRYFLILIVLYHILITTIQYGMLGGSHPEVPAILRDGVRFLYVICVCLLYVKERKSYSQKRKRPRICLGALLAFSVIMSYTKGKNISDMLVGIKYGFLYLPIFLSATFLGHLRKKKDANMQHSTGNMQHFLKFVKYFLSIVIIVGFLWQVAKFIRPDRFMRIGYGHFNDFVFGAKPPVYYLTGYQGTSRRQGLFSGPNNYGYFLIALLPAIIVLCKSKREGFAKRVKDILNRQKDQPACHPRLVNPVGKGNAVFLDDGVMPIVPNNLKLIPIKQLTISKVVRYKKAVWNYIIVALRILAIVLTLSRTATIGGIVALALVNMQRIRQHKKITGGLGILVIIGLIGLSILKGASTLGHIQAKFGSLKYVLQSPSGYGLGTSGPAIHHNGTILPENYFLQLILDIGTIGFILRVLCVYQIQGVANKIKRYFANTKDAVIQQAYTLRFALTIGRIALLIMGLFLHVFEDSMVNYIFFVLRGVLSGYLFAGVRK